MRNNFRDKIAGRLLKGFTGALLLLTVLMGMQATSLAQETRVEQEIRYFKPGVETVFLVWGDENWAVVPAELRPAGTVIEDALMHTPMQMNNGTFLTTLHLPPDSVVRYGFLITETNGNSVKIWEADQHQDYQLIVPQQGVEHFHDESGTTSRSFVFYLAAWITFILGSMLLFYKLTFKQRQWPIVICLLFITLIALGFRLWVVADANLGSAGSFRPLVGDEPGYDYLAYALLQGEFFQWPGRTPVYPLFLAAIYAVFGHSYLAVQYLQALGGTLVIPLTFLLASRLTNQRNALLAALIIAVHPTMSFQTTRLYSEVLYTVLLLSAILCLLWALTKPNLSRFILAGILMAVVTLTRPTTVLFPLLIPLLLPTRWTWRQRLTGWLAYGFAMALVIAPWSYHNFKTYDTFMPLSVSTAVLWQGSPEYYHLMEQKRTLVQIWANEMNPALNGGHDAFTIEGDQYFTDRAIESIKAEPAIYLRYALEKAAYLWIGHPANDWPGYAFFNIKEMRLYFSERQIAAIFIERFMPFLALFSLLILSLQRRLKNFRLFLLLFGYLTFMYGLTFAEVRYSQPLHPLLAIIIVTGLGETINQIQKKFLRNFWPQQLTKHQQAPWFSRLIYLRDLLCELVARDIKLRYKRSLLGMVWSLINPLAQLLVLQLIFGFILRLDIPNYASFMFIGLLVWTWFQSALFNATSVIVDNPDLIKRPGFPVAVLPIVTVTTHLIHFLLALPILLIFLSLRGFQMDGIILILPFIILIQFILTLSLSYFVAAVHVNFRDTQYLLGIILLLGFYLSPIFYEIEAIPQSFQWVYHLNPMVDLIDMYRAILMQGQLPNLVPISLMTVFSLITLWAGYKVFTQASYRFVEEI